jgi:adenylate cyclase
MVVVRYLNNIFSRFDDLADKFGIEKIKTIGDAYMGVCGIPEPNEDHVAQMCRFALAIVDALEDFNNNQPPGEPKFGLRTGINCGNNNHKRCIFVLLRNPVHNF